MAFPHAYDDVFDGVENRSAASAVRTTPPETFQAEKSVLPGRVPVPLHVDLPGASS